MALYPNDIPIKTTIFGARNTVVPIDDCTKLQEAKASLGTSGARSLCKTHNAAASKGLENP